MSDKRLAIFLSRDQADSLMLALGIALGANVIDQRGLLDLVNAIGTQLDDRFVPYKVPPQ